MPGPPTIPAMKEARCTAPFLALAALLACSRDNPRPVDVITTSIFPAPGAFDISRRVQVRTAFDVAVDPTSCTTSTCLLEAASGGRVAVEIAYDPATRLLTLTPTQALDASAGYSVHLTRGLRTALGAPFARAIEWTFTTDDGPVWDLARQVAEGTLQAAAESRTGGALATWTAADGALQFAKAVDGNWSPAVNVGFQQPRQVAVADDSSGNVVVAATSALDNLSVMRRAVGEAFQVPEPVGTLVSGRISIDSDAGHVLVAGQGNFAGGTYGVLVRTWVQGLGWTPPSLQPAADPAVHVDAFGQGTVVLGFNRVEPFVSALPWCERLCIDPLGAITACDPRPALPNSVVRASRTTFDGERILSAQTVETTSGSEVTTTTRVFQWRPGLGWQLYFGIYLGADPAAYSVASGNGADSALATIAAGLRPVVWTAVEGGLAQNLLGSDDQPAPPNPATAVVVTRNGRRGVLWTAAVDGTVGAPVRLLAATQRPGQAWSEPMVVDGPFAPEAVPVIGLRAVAVGIGEALAIWSRNGTVRSARLW